jgi:hypothetical protein
MGFEKAFVSGNETGACLYKKGEDLYLSFVAASGTAPGCVSWWEDFPTFS